MCMSVFQFVYQDGSGCFSGRISWTTACYRVLKSWIESGRKRNTIAGWSFTFAFGAHAVSFLAIYDMLMISSSYLQNMVLY